MRYRLGEIRLAQSPKPALPKPNPPDKVVERAKVPPTMAKAPKPDSTALPVSPVFEAPPEKS
jgi:hypothetical protein